MKVAIVGFGVEGQASFRYYTQLGADITIVDENEQLEYLPEGVPTILGNGAFEKLEGFDLIIRSPQISPKRIRTDGKIWSATNEFFVKCSAPIIGVTGTKGKGTTCSLIVEILKAAGKTVHLVGNIGVPALDELGKIQPDDIVVFELSSFQLWDLEKSPETAVVLMIEADHLDVHDSMEEYVNAKANIALHQTSDDVLIHHPSNEYALRIVEKSPAKKVAYMEQPAARIVIPEQAGIQKSDWIPDQVWDDGKGEWVVIENEAICRVDEVGLIGAHNLENICAAITAAWKYTQDTSAIKSAVTSFKGLPHRLEFVREVAGIKYYDDSYSANPAATIAAIKSFGNDPIILITGGYDRGQDYAELANAVSEQQNVKKIVVIGETSGKLAESLTAAGIEERNIKVVGSDFQEAIKISAQLAEEGDVILLSPGSPSFDMFRNFEERGKQFKKIVGEL